MKEKILLLSKLLLLSILVIVLVSGCQFFADLTLSDDNAVVGNSVEADVEGVKSVDDNAEGDNILNNETDFSELDETDKNNEIFEDKVIDDSLENGFCNDNADCAIGFDCIDDKCGKVIELYNTDCEKKCNFNQVKVSTDKGDSYTLNRGQGSYTAAGAVEWKLIGGPDYCPGDEVIVPIKLLKKNLGKVLSEEVLTLNPGEESGVVGHPTIKSIAFKVTVESVNEECE
jgi:hypothetical protein